MSEIERYHPHSTDSWIEVLGPVGTLAKNVARTEFVPKSIRGNENAVAAAILTGREMNLGPMASLRGIDVIEGRPSLTAQMLTARILAAGHRVTWGSVTDRSATVKIERGDGLSEAEATWSMADATRAGLAGKQVWQKYPRAMLRARALTEAAQMACPDVALGLDVDAEPSTTEPAPARQVVTLAPHIEPAAAPAAATEVVVAADMGTWVDAAIVDGSAPDTEHPAPEPDPVTQPQLRKMGALMNEIGMTDRAKAIEYVAAVIGRNIDTRNDLTKDEASAVIDALTTQQAADHVATSDQEAS